MNNKKFIKIITYCVLGIFCSFFLGAGSQVAYAAGSARLLLQSTRAVVGVHDTFVVSVIASSPTQAMNAVSGQIDFPKNLQLLRFDTDKSIVSFWTVEPVRKNNSINFEGVILNPGYRGEGGLLFQAVFRSLVAGSDPIKITSGSILANDGRGTNIVSTLGSVAVRVGTPQAANVTGSTPEPEPTDTVTVDGLQYQIPEITEAKSASGSGDYVYVSGKGLPMSIVELEFARIRSYSIAESAFGTTPEEAPQTVRVATDQDGNFVYTSLAHLPKGQYTVTPYALNADTLARIAGNGVTITVGKAVAVGSISPAILFSIADFVLLILLYGMLFFHKKVAQRIQSRSADIQPS